MKDLFTNRPTVDEWRSLVSLQFLRNLRTRDRERSIKSANQTPAGWIELMIDELRELAAALESDDPAAVIDEAGDVFGNAFSLLLALEASGLDPKAMVDRQLEKFEHRKPYIMNDFIGERPASVEEEQAMWDKRKASERGKPVAC